MSFYIHFISAEHRELCPSVPVFIAADRDARVFSDVLSQILNNDLLKSFYSKAKHQHLCMSTLTCYNRKYLPHHNKLLMLED